MASRKDVRLLHNRLTFGGNALRIEQDLPKNRNTIVTELLNLSNAIQPPVPRLEDGTTWILEAAEPGVMDGPREDPYKRWWLSQMYHCDNILEKLTYFLHTLIPTSFEVNGGTRQAYFQNVMYRQYIINDFNDVPAGPPDLSDPINPYNRKPFNRYNHFIKKMCIDNAMLRTLDNGVNTKSSPNENFARELLELYTLGVVNLDNQPNYTEEDIEQVAKAITGWQSTDNGKEYGKPNEERNLDRDILVRIQGVSPVNPIEYVHIGKVKDNVIGSHDNSVKQLSTNFGDNIIISPDPALLSNGQPTAESVEDELDQLIDIIFNRPDNQAAIFFCMRLYKFFVSDVYEKVGGSVKTEAEDMIRQLATTFRASNYRIRPVLDQLFTSQHFYEAGAGVLDDKFGALIKSPIDLTIGTLRFFRFNDGGDKKLELANINTDPENGHKHFGVVLGAFGGMGFDFLRPFDVAGYDGYHQRPGFSQNWISVTTLANRYSFIQRLMQEANDWGFYLNPLDWVNNVARSGVTDTIATTATTISIDTTTNINAAKTLVIHLAERVFSVWQENNEITEKRHNYFAGVHYENIIDLNANNPDNFPDWVTAWGLRNSLPQNATVALLGLFNALLQSPEYQLT